jgi:hypothetical protein
VGVLNVDYKDPSKEDKMETFFLVSTPSTRGWAILPPFRLEQALMSMCYRARLSSIFTFSSRRTPCYHSKVRLCPPPGTTTRIDT